MSTTARRARRTSILLVLAALLLVLSAPSANAAQVSFSAQSVSGTSAVFRVTGVAPAQIRQAKLRVGRYGKRVPAGQVRRGTLRLRLPVRVAQGLPQGTVSQASSKRRWPKLTIVTTPAAGTPAAPTSPAAGTSKPVSPAPKQGSPAPQPAPTAPAPPSGAPTDPQPAPTPGTPVAESSSGFEDGGFSEFTSLQNKFGSLSVTGERAYEGSRSARATWFGGPQGAQRVWKDTNWNNGSEVWYGMAVYVPDSTDYCYWNPIRWDNYDVYGGVDDDKPGEGDVGGLSIEQNRIYIMKSYYGGVEHKLVDGGTLAKGRWTWLELHQKFSNRDGDALSELYVDGQKKGSSTMANSAGREITDLRAGVVNVASTCSTPNTIDFDRVTISNSQRGPAS